MRKSEEIPQFYFHLTFCHSGNFCLVVSLHMPLNSMTQKSLKKGAYRKYHNNIPYLSFLVVTYEVQSVIGIPFYAIK